MNPRIGLVLTQIASLYHIGFNEFSVWAGMTGPVGALHPRMRSRWRGARD